VEAMVQIDRERPDLRMVLQIHDELDFYIEAERLEEDAEYICGVLRSIPEREFGIPFPADWSIWSDGRALTEQH
jgi:DNA polymerase I-like protein with 3'-5' exonuclease and polymerase domains